MKNDNIVTKSAKQTWVEPQIRELDVRETSNRIGRGADVGGNPSIDCQFS